MKASEKRKGVMLANRMKKKTKNLYQNRQHGEILGEAGEDLEGEGANLLRWEEENRVPFKKMRIKVKTSASEEGVEGCLEEVGEGSLEGVEIDRAKTQTRIPLLECQDNQALARKTLSKSRLSKNKNKKLKNLRSHQDKHSAEGEEPLGEALLEEVEPDKIMPLIRTPKNKTNLKILSQISPEEEDPSDEEEEGPSVEEEEEGTKPIAEMRVLTPRTTFSKTHQVSETFKANLHKRASNKMPKMTTFLKSHHSQDI